VTVPAPPDPKASQIEIEDESSAESMSNETVFLVSKKFISKFRKLTDTLLKAVAASELHSQGTHGNGKAVAYCEGLDAVDFSDFDPKSSSGELDPHVNSSITCKLHSL